MGKMGRPDLCHDEVTPSPEPDMRGPKPTLSAELGHLPEDIRRLLEELERSVRIPG